MSVQGKIYRDVKQPDNIYSFKNDYRTINFYIITFCWSNVGQKVIKKILSEADKGTGRYAVSCKL
jgi:hypothetical protein